MIKLEKIIILTNKNYIKILYKGELSTNNKYFKFNNNNYIIIDENTKIINSDNEDNILNYLEIKNKLTELEEKLEENNTEFEEIFRIEAKRKDAIIFWVVFSLLSIGIITATVSIFFTSLLKVVLASIIPSLIAINYFKNFTMNDKPKKKEILDALLSLENESEELTKEIEQLQHKLSKLNLQKINFEKLNLQKINFERLYNPIITMKHYNSEVKPLTKKLTNNKTRNQ